MSTGAPIIFIWGVALRKESVDRNKFISNVCPPVGRSLSARRAWIEIISVRGHGFWPRVALRKESVDRNLAGGHFIDLGQKSLSARRAWIEIISVRGHGFWPRWSLSARRAWIEIVDVVSVQHGCESLSARRAWIEIVHRGPHHFYLGVALRKESVDRNIRDLLPCGGVFSRSPQGERG